MPLLLVLGLALVLGGDEQALYKVGVIVDRPDQPIESLDYAILQARYVDFLAIPAAQQAESIAKVGAHQLDLLLLPEMDASNAISFQYWVNDDAPKGYAVEQILLQIANAPMQRQALTGSSPRYVDFLIPGVLGMNIMFSCLFGVGYVLVRYRKSGFLKRLNATPLTAVEFLTAQILSRLTLIVLATVLVYLATDALLDFRMLGSYWALLLLLIVGSACMIALGLLIAARVSSEELAGGLLNLISWPMMVLSGVWFSLEGSPQWVQYAAQILPLTHIIDGARMVMLDGGDVTTVLPQLLILAAMGLVFMLLGAAWFRWRQ